MKSNTVAIDMGSSNTGIYRVGMGIVLYEPSVVALSRDEKRKVKEVGLEAKKLVGRASDSTEVVWPVFESEIEDEAAAVAMLELFLNKITLSKLSARPDVVLSVPCGADVTAVRRFERVLTGADVTSYSIVESPVLTAIGLGLPLSSQPVFIIDIGGGSTEIAAVSGDGIICGISVNMGGLSIDAMVSNHIEEMFDLKIGSLTAEKLKLSVGSLYYDDNVSMVVNGRDVFTGRPRAVSVCSGDIARPIAAFFDKIFQITGMVMAKLPAEVSADIRRTGVYFAGGVSKTVGLEEYFSEKMGMKANISDKGDVASLLGGGMLASSRQLLEKYKLNKR